MSHSTGCRKCRCGGAHLVDVFVGSVVGVLKLIYLDTICRHCVGERGGVNTIVTFSQWIIIKCVTTRPNKM